jgi:hypothetical protein
MYVDQKEIASKMFNPFRVCAKQLTSMRIPARRLLCQQQAAGLFTYRPLFLPSFIPWFALSSFLYWNLLCRKFCNKGCDWRLADSFISDYVDPAFEWRHIVSVSDITTAAFFRVEAVSSKRFHNKTHIQKNRINIIIETFRNPTAF